MRRPGGLLPPPHASGGGNAEQVDGVGLQVFQEMLRFLSGQLDLGDCAVVATAVGQAVGGDAPPTQLLRERLPGHLDVCRTVAGQAEFWGPEGNWGARTPNTQLISDVRGHLCSQIEHLCRFVKVFQHINGI